MLIKKCWRESRWLLLGCAAATFAFCWLRAWMVSRLSTDRFRAILEMLPGDWRKFIAVDFEWLITYPGRMSLAYQELIVLLCVAIWSIARGSDVVSGELSRGTMELLLAQPVSRMRVLWTSVTVTILGIAVISGAAFVGTGVGVYAHSTKEEVFPKVSLPLYLPGVGSEVTIPFGTPTTRMVPMRDRVNMRLFLPATANLFSFGVMIAGFSVLMSAWDRYRWRTIGIVTGSLVVQMILKIVGMGVDSARWLKLLTLLSAYEPESFVKIADRQPGFAWSFAVYDGSGHWTGFGPLASDLLLVGFGSVSIAIGSLIFAKRDLPTAL